jgi:hypothetical protein
MPKYRAEAIEVNTYELLLTADSEDVAFELANNEEPKNWVKLKTEYQITGVEDVTIEDAVIVEENTDGE